MKDFFVLSILLLLFVLGSGETLNWVALMITSVIGTVLLKLINQNGRGG